MYFLYFFFFKQKTAYEMRIMDWSSDVCSSDLRALLDRAVRALPAVGAGAGGDAGRDVCPGRFDAQGQGDHRRAVRPCLLGLDDLGDQQEARWQPGGLCPAPPRRAVPLSDP